MKPISTNPQSPITKIPTVCPHDCPDTCGILTEVRDGRAVRISGDPDHPITQGWLCAKVRPYLDHVYHPDRLTHPLRRVGEKGAGKWQRITWGDAIAEIADRWQRIIAEYGAAAILPYSYSGTLGLVQMSAVNARLWNRMGASRLERAICGEAAEMAVKATLGRRWSVPYAAVRHSRLVILWGHNPVSTAPHFMPFLTEARRNGTQVIVIDPRRTRTARLADWHIAPKPGTDGALALAMAHVLVAEGFHDEEWLAENTIGWEDFPARLVGFSPRRAADITGIPADDIIRLARRYATERPSLIKIADGLQRHSNGGQTVRAILTLPALTGQYGVRGGGLAYSASGYVKWSKTALNHWEDCPPPAREINMNRLGAALTSEISDPPIQSLFVYGANPVASSPNTAEIVRGLRRPDLFTVVHDLFLTDTADFADIVLPATSQLEHTDLHKGYGHTFISYNQQAIAPLGESKSNWAVMRLLARAMGFTEPWLFQSPDEIITEILSASAAENPALTGITLERLKREHTIALEVPEVPFADLDFPTPSGKVEIYSQTLADAGLDPLPNFTPPTDPVADAFSGTGESLAFISGAAHHFTSSTFANHADFLAREKEPFVEIHPSDAAARGITDGDLVRLENARGWVNLRARVTDDIRPGVVASPKGRWRKYDPFSVEKRNINWLTSDALGDFAGQSTFHSTRVWIRQIANDEH